MRLQSGVPYPWPVQLPLEYPSGACGLVLSPRCAPARANQRSASSLLLRTPSPLWYISPIALAAEAAPPSVPFVAMFPPQLYRCSAATYIQRIACRRASSELRCKHTVFLRCAAAIVAVLFGYVSFPFRRRRDRPASSACPVSRLWFLFVFPLPLFCLSSRHHFL